MVLSLRKLENYLPEKDPAINKGYDQFPVGYVPGDRMYFKYDPNTVSEISRLATIMNKVSGNALVGKPAKKPAAPTPKPQVKTVVTDSSKIVTPQPQVESKTQSKKVVVPKKKVTTTTTIGYDESFDKYKMGGATSPLRKVRIIKHPSQTPMMERGGTIPKFQPGGNWAKKPDGTIYWKLRDGSEGKPPIEAIDDLKAKKKIDWSGPIYSIYEDKLKTDPKRKKNFDKMWSIFTDPKNKAMVDEFYNDYKNKSTAAGLPVLDEDKFLEVLKTGQMQTYALTDNKLDHDKWDSRTNRNKEYRKAMRELGYTPMDDATIKQFQTIYHTLQDISQQDKFKPVFGKFKLAPVSKDRNDMRGGLPVSKIDGIFGDTTANQTIMLLDEPEEIKEKEKEKEKEKDKEITEIQEKHFYDEPYYVPPAEEWLQDKMQRAYNIRGRSRAKKIEPTAYMPNLYLPTPTMYDPTREAAAIGEMASIGARQAAALGEPQQFAATYSGIQGRAARDIANAFGRYENMNVGVANQYENVRANLLNRWSGMRSSTLNDLTKQKAVADQQWINEQNMWDEKTTRDNIQAVTNAAQTDVMNSMYPQYAIDPSTGGFRPYFLRGRKMKPGSSRDEQDILRDIAEIRKSDKDMTYGEALKIYQMSHPEMNAQDIYMQNPHRYPQYSTGPYSGGTGYGPYQEDAEDENYYTT
jgi:hypothetical protein